MVTHRNTQSYKVNLGKDTHSVALSVWSPVVESHDFKRLKTRQTVQWMIFIYIKDKQ